MSLIYITSILISILLATPAESHRISSTNSHTLKVHLYDNTASKPTLYAQGNSSMTGGQQLFSSSAKPKKSDGEGDFSYEIKIDQSAGISLEVNNTACVEGTRAIIAYSKKGKPLSSVKLNVSPNSNAQLVCEITNTVY